VGVRELPGQRKGERWGRVNKKEVEENSKATVRPFTGENSGTPPYREQVSGSRVPPWQIFKKKKLSWGERRIQTPWGRGMPNGQISTSTGKKKTRKTDALKVGKPIEVDGSTGLHRIMSQLGRGKRTEGF